MNPFDLSWMVGRHIDVSESGDQWFFALGDSRCISVYCPWRLLLKGKFCLSSEDHKQKYGRSAPINAATEANRLLNGFPIVAAEIRLGTGDLVIRFNGELTLEVLPIYRGYEAWQISTPDGRNVLAGCAGELFSL